MYVACLRLDGPSKMKLTVTNPFKMMHMIVCVDTWNLLHQIIHKHEIPIYYLTLMLLFMWAHLKYWGQWHVLGLECSLLLLSEGIWRLNVKDILWDFWGHGRAWLELSWKAKEKLKDRMKTEFLLVLLLNASIVLCFQKILLWPNIYD